MNKKKTSISEVMKDIRPYINKGWFSKPSVDMKNVELITKILLSQYKNVELKVSVPDGVPYLFITVKGLFGSDTKQLEINDYFKWNPKSKSEKEREMENLELMRFLTEKNR